MKKNLNHRKITYFSIAMVLFLCLLFLTFPKQDNAEKQGVQIVFFGDSVYGNTRDESSIPHQVGKLLDKTVYNGAFGGTSASRAGDMDRMDYSDESLSLTALASAVYAKDFGVQQTISATQTISAYFMDAIDGLEKIDFAEVETVIIGHGINDYHLGVASDNEKNDKDTTTFGGALRRAVELLRKTNPHIRIVLVTPTYSWLVDGGLTCEEFNGGGGILEEYVETELAIARECGVDVIDLYHDVFPHETWEDWGIYTFDGVHPNEAGRALIAKKIAEYLEGEAK